MFKKIIRSVSDSTLYKEVVELGLGKAIKFFIKVSTILAILVALISAIFLIPTAKLTISEFSKIAISKYPEGLIIDVKEGKVLTNSTTTVAVTLDAPIKDSKTQKETKNILVIDTKAENSLTAYENSSALVLITESQIIYPDNNKSQMVFASVAPLSGMNITKEKFERWISYGSKIPYLIPFGVFGFLFMRGFFLLLQMLIIALILFVVFKIIKHNKTYKESYVISLYASLVPFIVTTVLFPVLNIPFVFTLATLVIALILTKEKTVVSPSEIVSPPDLQ